MIEFSGKKITIMATSNCNVKCKHCYISYTGSFDPDVLNEVASILSKKYFVSINGAELLTNSKYLDVLSNLNQVGFMSNGLIVSNPETIAKLKECNIECVAMSMHYGIHDEISVIPQSLIEHNVKVLSENGINSKIFVTLTKKNYMLVPEICEYVKSIGAKGVWFTNYIKQGAAINLSDNNVLGTEEKTEFFRLLSEARSKYSKEELCIERCGSFGEDLYSGKKNFKCTAIHDFVVMTPDYNIYPCFFLAKPGNEIGKYVDGKVFLYDNYRENWEGCLTARICNDGDYYFDNHKLVSRVRTKD
jgi:MoaA/NifB/PqqE/SkfB family radical SAM enzyme